ncbi:MAG: radical SAM protein [Eubacteriales bacterium]
MRIALHDAEKEHMPKKSFPNLALMKLSAFHKSHGDTVEWWTPLAQYDRVYSSKVFDFTPENPYLPPHTIRGGTGYKDIPLNQTLPDDIDETFPDYSIYSNCDYAIGYLTRGCPRKCPWCVVPSKEGEIKAYRTWQEVVRSDTKKLTLLDNNILACDHGISQLAELAETDYKIDLNQGMDARLVTPEIADILAKCQWQGKNKSIRFSCDQKSQIEDLHRVCQLMGERGVLPYRIFVYVLVTKEIEDAAFRVEALKKHKGIFLYAQPERNDSKGIIPNGEQMEFAQRFVYKGAFRKKTWEEYKNRRIF